MAVPRTLRMTVAYDGTNLVGWQRQPEGVSVQALLEEALAAFDGHPVTVVGAGRTDAGVHASGQVASCRLDHPIVAERLRAALNARLPPDVQVLRIDEVPHGFHARHGARAKTYRYLLLEADRAWPHVRRVVWPVGGRLDVASMREAARGLEGERDFAALQGSGSAVRTTVRRLTSVTVSEVAAAAVFGPAILPEDEVDAPPVVVIEFTGSGFLRHMVRNAVGCLVEVGRGRQSPGWIAEVLSSRDRARAAATAPACGLSLVRVHYDEPATALADTGVCL